MIYRFLLSVAVESITMHLFFSANSRIATPTMSKFNISLHHVSLIVADTQKSLMFYTEVLGLKQTERPDLGFPGAWFQLGDQQVHLMELDNPDPTTGRPEHGGRDRHVAFSVTALAPVKKTLEQAGIFYTLSKSGRKALFCRDPDGNAIELIERD
jgi:glyoxylase I family protein